MHRALAVETDAAVHDRIMLRDAVCAYFTAERARGATVPDITEILKDVLKRADGVEGGTEELAHRLIDWCLKLRASPGF